MKENRFANDRTHLAWYFHRRIYFVGLIAVFFAPLLLRAETYTSPKQAGPIFAFQGEYVGVIEAWGGTWGAQVIATSEKSVELHLLPDGLPGLGADVQKTAKVASATLDSARRLSGVSVDSANIQFEPKAITISDSVGKKMGVLTKIVRESSTLGAKPPKDAIVLFSVNGENRFRGSKTSGEGFLQVGCVSEDTFHDHQIHIEFMTPFQPEDQGQKRGNSGVYIQGRYEVQILDSFGLAGRDNECGGIYRAARPKINMCYPPLTWQTFDIDFVAPRYSESGSKTRNARITVRHNGVLIHDQWELNKSTPGKDGEGTSPGPLFLQNHNNPVVFKNIWVVRK